MGWDRRILHPPSSEREKLMRLFLLLLVEGSRKSL